MKIFKKTNSFVLMLLVAMIATSCSDKEVFDSTAIYNQKKSEFTSNFIKKYGEIDPNQTWDFSTGSHVYSMSLPKATRGATRAVTADPADYLTIQDWYELPKSTLEWMKATLKEQQKKTEDLGFPFHMDIPNNVFYIVPIYEGQADFVWTLHIVVDDYDGNGESLDIRVWKKGENIQQQTAANPEWANIEGGSKEKYNHTMNATALRAKPIAVDLTQFKGKKMYLYLENTKNGIPRNPASSLAKTMLTLNVPDGIMPALNVPNESEYEKKIIACEDQVLPTSDHDYNDVVFMIYGKPIPKINLIEEPIYDSFSMRYMIEDLGTTDDFDFNDVVVDVFDVTSKTAVYEEVNGNKLFKEWKNEEHSQNAIVRSLGGTLDITLQIGTTTWTKSESKYPVSQMVNTSAGNIDYNAVLAEFPIINSDWEVKKHNISAVVGDKKSGNVLTITFPKKGEAPMILGFDVNEFWNWMPERQSIPSSWFTEVDD